MSLNPVDLLVNIITPTLQVLEMSSPTAEEFLLGSAARASGFNPFPAEQQGIGLYRISSEQHRSAWDDYLAFRPDLASKVRGLASQHQFLKNPDLELMTNLVYSTAIAWILFLQSSQVAQASNDAA